MGKNRLGSNIAVGIKWGLYFAGVYSIYVVAVVVWRGPSVLERHGVGLAETVAVYVVGGVLGGTIAGPLLPWSRRPLGAGISGFFAALPVFTAAGMTLLPPEEWVTTLPGVAIGLPAILGPICGVLLWYINTRL